VRGASSLDLSSRRKPGPIATDARDERKSSNIVLEREDTAYGSRLKAGTTIYRQCNNLVSSQLINRPTASPNSDRITTPANS
jgi:hypothetical protein